MPRVVVLGTGTGVGKTYFTAALARALANLQLGPVLAVKPVETGFPAGLDGRRASSDAGRLKRVSTAVLTRPELVYRFRPPLSPHLAARLARRRISLKKLQAWIQTAEDDMTLHGVTMPWVLIETAGGALSPLTAHSTNVDFAAILDPAIWILVAPDALGVLHDVRATLLALRHAAREPDFVVLSSARARDRSTGTNARELSRLGIVKPIATLPRGSNPQRALAHLVEALRNRARPNKTRR